MEFTVATTDLVRELSLSQGVIEKKTTIPILSNVLLQAVGDKVQLTATDLELAICCSCPATVEQEGSGTLPARKLLDYVRLLPGADLKVKFLENQWASLVCGRSRTRIAGMSHENYPELPRMPDPIAELQVGLLTSMISRTIIAIASEDTRFALSGALLVLKPTGVTTVATDGHRLSLVESETELSTLRMPYRALLPRKAMLEILKLAQEVGADAPLLFSGDENHLFFRIGERLLVSRKLTGNFPDYERVLAREQPHCVTLPRDDFRATIERVAQFADERSRAIKLRFAPGQLDVYSSLSDTGESEETLPLTFDGPSVEIGFNASYLLDFLRVTSEREFTFAFKDHQSAGELRPIGSAPGFKCRYIVMPIRN